MARGGATTGEVNGEATAADVATIRALAAPARPFVLRERYVRVECDVPGYEGLWAEVRLNLSNGEREAFVAALDEAGAERERMRSEADLIDAAVKDAKGGAARAQAAADRHAWIAELAAATEREAEAITALLSPYVRAWNLGWVDDETGESGTVDPPATGGPAVWEHADDTIRDWLRVKLITAYRGGKGVRSSSPPPARQGSGTPQPSGARTTTEP